MQQRDTLNQTWKSEENIQSSEKERRGKSHLEEAHRAVFSFQEIKLLDESETVTFQHRGRKVWPTG